MIPAPSLNTSLSMSLAKSNVGIPLFLATECFLLVSNIVTRLSSLLLLLLHYRVFSLLLPRYSYLLDPECNNCQYHFEG